MRTALLAGISLAFALQAGADPGPLGRGVLSCSLVEAREFESGRLREAAFALSDAESARRPALGLSAQDDRQNHEGTALRQRVDAMDLSVPLYDRTLSASVDAGRERLSAEKARLVESAAGVAEEATSSVLALFRARAHLEVLRAELATVERLALVSGAAEQAGLGDRSDALLARAALARIRVRVDLAAFEVERYARLFEKRHGYQPPEAEPEVKELEPTGEGGPVNPALATSLAEVSALNAQLSSEKALWLPKLGLSGGVYRQSGDLPHEGYRVGLQVDLSGWFRSGDARVALEARRLVTESRLAREQRVWSEEQRLLEEEFRALTRQQESLARAGAASERALELARERMALGRLRFTEFAQIQNELRELKFEIIDLRSRRLALALRRIQQRALSRVEPPFDDARCPWAR